MLSWYAILVFACAAPPATSAPATALPEIHLKVSPYRHCMQQGSVNCRCVRHLLLQRHWDVAQCCDRIQQRLMAVSRTQRL